VRPALLPLALAGVLALLRPADADPPADLRGAVVTRLRAALSDPDRGVRWAAVEALAKAGEPAGTITPALEDRAWCVRRQAGWWLRRGGESGFAALETALAKGSPPARATAAWALSSFGARSVDALRRALADVDGEVRLEALAAARRIGEPATALGPEISRSLAAAAAEERYEAALALASVRRGDAAAAVPILLAEATNPAFGDAHEAELGLLLAGPEGENAMAGLGKEGAKRGLFWRDARVDEPAPAIPGKGATPPQRAEPPAPPTTPPDPALARGIGDGPVLKRVAALRALAKASVDAAVLAPALVDAEPDVRVAAAVALGSARGDRAGPALRALADPDARVVRAAIRALGLARAAGAEVAPFLADPALPTSIAARDALAASGRRAAVPVAEAMRSGHHGVLAHATWVFDAIAAEGVEAVPPLEALLAHADVNVRETAARCLRAIGPGSAAAAPTLARALGDRRLCVVAHAALALGSAGVTDALRAALDAPRARARAYAAFAAGWALGEARGLDQVPYEARLPVEDGGGSEGAPTAAELARAANGPPEALRALHLRAIRSKDPAVALRACAALDYGDLDAEETERAIEVMLPEGLRRGTPVDFDRLRSMIASSEVPALVLHLCRARASSPAPSEIFGHLHRSSRADLLPALYWLDRVEEPAALAEDGALWMPAGTTSRYLREAACHQLGRDPGSASADAVRALLADFVVDPESELGGPLRWALAELVPGSEDEPLLLRAAETARRAYAEEAVRHPDVLATLRALGALDGEDSLKYLEKAAEDEDEEARLVATAALARRGVPWARGHLADRSRGDGNALTLLLEADPDLAADRLAYRLRDPWEADPALDLVRDLPANVTALGARIRDDAFLGVEAAVAASPPSARVLARVATTVPGCATKRLAARLFAALAVETPSFEEEAEQAWGDALFLEATAFLASVDAARTTTLLRGWSRAREARLRGRALDVLKRLGDRESAPAIVAHLRAANPAEPHDRDLRWLERVATPEVLSFLREVAVDDEEYGRDDALEALARAQGLPTRVWLAGWLAEGSREDELRAAVLAGEMEKVRAAVLAPPTAAWDRLAEAARAGDVAATAELWSALRAGRYRWLNEAWEKGHHSLPNDAAALPHWVSDLDSNCCRVSDGLDERVFEEPYAIVDLYASERAGVGQAPSAKALTALAWTGRWTWSPVLDRYVPRAE
jgi:HEAT repeat protein